MAWGGIEPLTPGFSVLALYQLSYLPEDVYGMTRLENRGHYNARYDSVKASFSHFFKQRTYKRSVF